MRAATLAGCLLVIPFFLPAIRPVGAGPPGHKRRCPAPRSYSRWTYWAAGAKRLGVLHHHRPVYQYPSDPYSDLPPSYLLLPYRCPPVGPARFYEELHGAREASSPGGLVVPEPSSGLETLPPPIRRPDSPPDGI